MKIVKFGLVVLVTLGLIIVLDRPLAIGEKQLPPLGRFLNPFSGFWQNAESIKQKDQQLDLEGLSAPVRVVYDERHVPHIFAESNADLFRVQGYVTAQHRLWQMDVTTRMVSGRLSEVMGERLLKRDQLQRRRGLPYAAENTLASWKNHPEEMQLLEAFTDGVNQYINSLSPGESPLEFKLLNYEPEPWSVYKSALLIKSMALTLCSRENDIESTNTRQLLGPEVFDALYPEYNPKQTPIVPSGTAWEFDTLSTEKADPILIGAIPHQPYEKVPAHVGSNNWAVAGSKTKSGNPILCNDPHLKLSLPSIWFEVQLHTPEMNIYGVSLPGFPGIVIGFNGHISWGMTNVGHDVLDWYQIKWADQSRIQYYLDGEAIPVSTRIETYKLADGQTVIDTVRYTKWGPIVYEDENHPQRDMAMRWLAHQGGSNELRMALDLAQARDFNAFEAAISQFHTPAQNMIFASQNGEIGIKVQGTLPLRAPQEGRFILDGSNSTAGWSGTIPLDQNPKIYNPERGYVGSANQHSTAPDYPYYYLGNFEDYRGRTLDMMLDSLTDIGVEEMMQLQANNFSMKAHDALPAMLQYMDNGSSDANAQPYLDSLRSWDFNYHGHLISPVWFETWFDHFYTLVWDEIESAETKSGVTLLYPESWRTIELLETEPDHPFFDRKGTPETETAGDLVRLAFTRTFEELQENPNAKWQDHKGTHIPHLSRLPALGRGKLPVGGHGSALNAIKRDFGPSWRMVVEMGQPLRAYGVYPGGQSGNPGSPHYDDMIDKWVKGEYFSLHYMQNADEKLDNISTTTQTFE